MDWEQITRMDWSDVRRIHTVASAALRHLSTSGELCHLLETLPTRESLVERCEHLRSLDKLVLYDHPESGIRLRLHMFSDEYLDLPHNHRWSYTTLMLAGGYTHYVFEPMREDSHTTPVTDLRPLNVQQVLPGAAYTLDHTVVHSLAASSATMTLVLRGPVMKSHATWTDRTTNQTWRHEGGASDTRMRPMSGETVSRLSEQALVTLRQPAIVERLAMCAV